MGFLVSGGVLEANFTWKSDAEYQAFQRYVDVIQSGDAAEGFDFAENSSSWLVLVKCLNSEVTADLCAAAGLHNAYFPLFPSVSRAVL